MRYWGRKDNCIIGTAILEQHTPNMTGIFSICDIPCNRYIDSSLGRAGVLTKPILVPLTVGCLSPTRKFFPLPHGVHSLQLSPSAAWSCNPGWAISFLSQTVRPIFNVQNQPHHSNGCVDALYLQDDFEFKCQSQPSTAQEHEDGRHNVASIGCILRLRNPVSPQTISRPGRSYSQSMAEIVRY